MANLNKYALVFASALALSTTSALANPRYNDCPYQDGSCNNYQNQGYHHNVNGNHKYNRGFRHNNYHNNYHGTYQRMHRFLENPKYAKDAKIIVDLADTLYAERRVLRALENAQDVDVNRIRKHALTLRKLERQYYDLKVAFFDNVQRDDPDLLNSSYYQSIEKNNN